MITVGQVYISNKARGRFAIMEKVDGECLFYRRTTENNTEVCHEQCNLHASDFLSIYTLIKDAE